MLQSCQLRDAAHDFRYDPSTFKFQLHSLNKIPYEFYVIQNNSAYDGNA